MKKSFKVIFIIVFFMICAYPLYGMLWYEEHEVTENKVLAAFPEFVDENGDWNINYMSELGDYFSDHFAGRQEFITANALVNGKIFKSSSEDIVVVGKDGWLYYKDSLGDYQGTKRMTQRGLNNIVTSLSLIQEYVEDLGKEFLFVVAPNKNSLYSQNMPYYYPIREKNNTLECLEPMMLEENIAYVDVKTMFLNAEGIYYHLGDSHWDNRGAIMVQNKLLDTLGKDYVSMFDYEPVIQTDFEGDLDKIFYPLARHQEIEWDYSKYFTFIYSDGNPDTTQPHIETTNTAKEGALVMVRDSFGNSLVPFMAEEFGEAYFTKVVPYRVDEMEKRDADVYIIEIVERNLDQFQRKAPVIPAPERNVNEPYTVEITAKTSVMVTNYDVYYKFSGMLDEAMVDDYSPVYLKLTDSQGSNHFYEMTPANEQDLLEVTSDYGYAGYIPIRLLVDDNYDIEVLTRKNGCWISSGVIGNIGQ